MDPTSAVGIVGGSLSLALQFGSAAKALNDIAGKYKKAKLTIMSLAQNLDILQLSWTHIGEWFQMQFEEGEPRDEGLRKRVEGFLKMGIRVMEALEHDLQAYNVDHLRFRSRSKAIWNETSLQGHQTRIRDQVLSMTLFLQAVKLPSPQARAELLQESENQFRKSRASVYSIQSILPSRKSVLTSHRNSYASEQTQGTIEYRQLSFEDRLFASNVYMRSSKNAMIKELSKARSKFNRNDKITARDLTVTVQGHMPFELEANNLLATNPDVSVNDKEPIEPHSTFNRNGTATVRDLAVVDREQMPFELEANSLLATNPDVSVNDNKSIEPHIHSPRKPPVFGVNSATSITSELFAEALLLACKQGDSLEVQRLGQLWSMAEGGLDLHAQFREREYCGWKGIHVAAKHGQIEVVGTLLGYGAMLEEENASHKWRPLHIAARAGQSAMVKFLIKEGAQIDVRADHEIQPIHEASRSGSIETVEALIEAGAAIDCSDRFGHQPLHCAANVPNRGNIVTYLIGKGADIEAKTSSGSRPLRLACATDCSNFRTLVALGARTEYDDGSLFPLEVAIRCGYKGILEALLKHGVDPNRENDVGHTALHTFALTGYLGSNCVEICQLLIDNGADVNLADQIGNQLLHHLADHLFRGISDTVEIEKVAKLAIDQGADIDATNRDGKSPLFLAICAGKHQLSSLFIRSGGRVLMRTDVIRAEVQVTVPDLQQTPRYTVNVWRYHDGLWKILEDFCFKLLVDEAGYLVESKMWNAQRNLIRCVTACIEKFTPM